MVIPAASSAAATASTRSATSRSAGSNRTTTRRVTTSTRAQSTPCSAVSASCTPRVTASLPGQSRPHTSICARPSTAHSRRVGASASNPTAERTTVAGAATAASATPRATRADTDTWLNSHEVRTEAPTNAGPSPATIPNPRSTPIYELPDDSEISAPPPASRTAAARSTEVRAGTMASLRAGVVNEFPTLRRASRPRRHKGTPPMPRSVRRPPPRNPRAPCPAPLNHGSRLMGNRASSLATSSFSTKSLSPGGVAAACRGALSADRYEVGAAVGSRRRRSRSQRGGVCVAASVVLALFGPDGRSGRGAGWPGRACCGDGAVVRGGPGETADGCSAREWSCFGVPVCACADGDSVHNCR